MAKDRNMQGVRVNIQRSKEVQAQNQMRSYWGLVWFSLRQDTVVLIGVITLLLVVSIVSLAPILPLADPTPESLQTANRLRPMFTEGSLLGTDQLGRDVLSRLIWGGRISLVAGVLSLLISIGIGMPIGLISGYFDNWVSALLMRLIDILMAIPPIVMAIVIVTILGASLFNAMIAVGLTGVGLYARLVRSSVLSAKQEDYVLAAHAVGASASWIILRHIVPNIFAPVLVLASYDIATKILATASLSFLGLGTQPPQPDWGNMLAEGRRYLSTGWHLSFVPGMAIFIVAMAANLVGDGLRDSMDPTLKGS